MSGSKPVGTCVNFVVEKLPMVENCFNFAGYIPGAVHRVSGGTRIVFGFAEMGLSFVIGVLIHQVGDFRKDRNLQREGWKVLDLTVHGVANVVRGFVECHAWFHLLGLLYDQFVQPEHRLRYDRSIFVKS